MRFSREFQGALNRQSGRVRATEHAPRVRCQFIERRHGLADIVERGDWVTMRRRQHCFRNLDVDYLTIKAFLLERFLHDALYEAPTAEVFNEFLDIRPAPAAQVSFASSPSLPRSAVSGSLSR